MVNHLLYLVLALSASEVTHNFVEADQVRHKVARLADYMTRRQVRELPVSIDSRPKSYVVSLFGLVLFTGIFYLLFSWLKLSERTSLILICCFLLIAYWILAVVLDHYHVDIEKITKKFKD